MMLIPLYCLLAQVHAEWVEIAQNNYRRNTLRKDHVEVDFTTEAYKYPNITMRPPEVHRGLVNRVSHAGNVRRVPFAAVTTSTLKIYPDESTSRPAQETTAYTNTDSASNKQEYYDIDFADLLKVTKFVNKLNRHNKPVATLNLSSLDIDYEIAHSYRNERINPTTKSTSIRKQTETGHISTSNMYSTSGSGFNFNDLNTETSTSSMMVINLNEKKDTNDYKSQQTKLNIKNDPPQINQKIVSKNPAPSSTIHNYPNLNKANEDTTNKSSKDLNTSKDLNLDEENTQTKPGVLEDFLDSQKPEVPKLDLKTSDKEYFSGMWRMLTFIKDIITKNTQRSVKSKIKYLEELKNNILNSIEDHINRVWPDDQMGQDQSLLSRAARSAHARGHVELPSSEGALMTISFLTFAVFLIKLVLQIIHAYKNKTMMMTPAVVTAVGRAAAATRSRH